MNGDKRKLFAARCHNLAVSTTVGVPCSIFQHSLWLSILMWGMHFGLLSLQDLCEEYAISPIWLSRHYTICSPSHAFPSYPRDEINLTSSPAWTSTSSTVTLGVSSEFQGRSLDFWCARGDCSSISWLYLAACHCHHFADSSILHSLENDFWVAQAHLSLLMFAHPVLKAFGWRHTLHDSSEPRCQSTPLPDKNSWLVIKFSHWFQ